MDERERKEKRSFPFLSRSRFLPFLAHLYLHGAVRGRLRTQHRIAWGQANLTVHAVAILHFLGLEHFNTPSFLYCMLLWATNNVLVKKV